MNDTNNNKKEEKYEQNFLKNNDINEYIIEEKLGEGIFGTVKSGIHKITQEKVAIKIMNKNRISKEQKALIDKEILIHKRLYHFNIIKLYSVIDTKDKLYLIQEYCSGKELSNYILNHQNLEEKKICKLFQQIISGIEYLHNMGIVHRDLKPENILLTRTNDIKIIDFGLSNFYAQDKNILLKTSCGSPYYAPPEMLKGEKYNGVLSDIYSCGVILYFMLTQKLPFNEKKDSDTYKKILSNKYIIPKNISKNAQDLIKKMLKLKPKERISIKEIKNHPWFNLCNIKENMHPGLNYEKNIFPIDEEIIKEMEKIGYNKMEVRYNLLLNEHNNITTCYYLLLDKKIKKGRKSIADLHSNLFEEYIKDDKNKIINYSTDIDNVIKKRINSKKILESIPAELINKEIENTDNKNNINKEKIINSKNIIKNNKERKSISCKNINKNINIKHKLSINIKPKRDIKILKFPCNDKERKILNSKARHKSLIIETKNNIINNKIIKPKILINKTIQNKLNLNLIKTKSNNNKRILSTETKTAIFKNITSTPNKKNIFPKRITINKKKVPSFVKEDKKFFINNTDIKTDKTKGKITFGNKLNNKKLSHKINK
jgi:5'-AMP-activated protein kinase catalytic alpha subunit